ncbi:MAG TPA: BON domain-containing protein [Verrucomicrobiae bacterium]|nr:BON domain-containing protein [Verrucomicrobiae bacterium]
MIKTATCIAVVLFAASAWCRPQTPIQQPRALPPQRGAVASNPPAQQPAPASATAAPVRKSSSATTRPRLPDAQLEAAIRAKFAKSKLAADKLTVRVQGGVATIEGRTNVVQHKGNATRMAKTAGALAVNNHVVVSDAAKEKAAANLEEGRRRAQIKRGDARSAPRQDGSSDTRKK